LGRLHLPHPVESALLAGAMLLAPFSFDGIDLAANLVHDRQTKDHACHKTWQSILRCKYGILTLKATGDLSHCTKEEGAIPQDYAQKQAIGVEDLPIRNTQYFQ
jgi:hypothetical protein